MKNKMTKLTVCIALYFGLLIHANGQTPPAYYEEAPVRDYTLWLDSVFMNVNTEGLSTNLLADRSLGIHDLSLYDGFTVGNNISPYLFEGLYNTLYMSCTDTMNPLADWENYVEPVWKQNNSYSSANIGLLFFDYDRVKPHAIDSGLLTTDGLYLYDPVPYNGNPFEKKTLFAGAASRWWFDTTDILFGLPSNLIFTNKGSIGTIMIDFGNGEGYVPVSPDTYIIVHYADTGKYTINITMTDGASIYHAQSTVNVRAERRYGTEITTAPLGKVFVVEAEEEARGLSGKAKATVTYAYGCGNTVLRKPLIIVPGINIPELEELTGERQTYTTFIRNLQSIRGNPDLHDLLESEGYDLVFIEYHHGADWIEKNAKLVQTVIRRVNQEKWDNGSTEPTVVYGESMGGVVARYALCEMEANNEMHDVERFISFDAPHNGANVPLGAQALLGHLNDIYVRLLGIPVFKLNSLVPEMRIAKAALINNGAVKQLLIDYYFHVPKWGSAGPRENLMAELDAFGFPKQVSARGNTIRNIILSNGSGAGSSGELFPSHSHLLEFSSNTSFLVPSFVSFLAIAFAGTGFSVNADIWAMPVNNAADLTVYHGSYYASVLGIFGNIISNRWFKVPTVTGLDHVQGGTINVEDLMSDDEQLPSGLVLHQPEFCFIPAVSSCALLPPFRDNAAYNINANYNQTTNTWANAESNVDFIITGRDVGTGVPQNQPHLLWNDDNHNFLVENTLPVPGSFSGMLSTGNTFNYGNNSSNILRSAIIMGTMRINANQATGLSTPSVPSALPVPANGSHFEVRTNGQHCNGGMVVVQVYNGGKLEIGDNATANTGTLVVGDGDILKIYAGGTLSVANNSKLIIESGAELEIAQGAIIVLEGANAVLEVRGRIRLENNAVLGPSKGSAPSVGYIHFIRQAGFSGNQIIAEWTNSKIVLEGTSKSNLLLRVEGGELEIPHPNSNPNQYSTSFSVTNGLIEVGTNSSIKCGSDIEYNAVRTRGTSGSSANTGLVLLGQANYSFTDAGFRDLNTGMQVLGEYSNRMELEDIFFRGCSYSGLFVHQSSVAVDNCKFYQNEHGIYIQYPTDDSEIKNSWFGYNTTGIHQVEGLQLSVEETIIMGGTTGIELSGDGGTLILNCAKFYSNTTGINAGENTITVMSPNPPNSLPSGGYNSFWKNGNSIHLQTAEIYIDNGKNNFIAEDNSAPYNFVTGLLPNSITSNIDANDNYWYPAVSGSDILAGNPDHYSIGNYSSGGGSHPTTLYFEGSLASSVFGYCYSDPSNTVWFVPESRVPAQDKDKKDNLHKIAVFPNPADNLIFVAEEFAADNHTEEKSSIRSVALFNMQGKLISNAIYTSGKWQIRNDNLAEGIYYLKIFTEQEVLVRQILIVK
ncbi:MAG: T9SS type A sorting domain-containing protein [Bacteroidetes bacterium]|nr:T9SS type A sorting domain-containing protein [Bacteroidota bacterium]